MSKNTLVTVGLVVLLLIGVFYVLHNNQKRVEEDKISQLNIATHRFDKVLAYENDYLGNASNTNNLFNNLPLSNVKQSIEMDSDKLVLTVNYAIASNAEVEKAIIYNATAAFVLIKNVKEVNMNFLNQSYAINRENVEKIFGDDFARLIEPAVFKRLVQNRLLENEHMDWLEQYTN